MFTIKNGQIWLYCHFNKMIKGSEITFTVSNNELKHVTNVCHTAQQYLTKFHFDSTQDSKELSINVTSIMQQYQLINACGFHKNIKIYISREQNIFSWDKKNHYLHIKGYSMAKNSFVEEVAFQVNESNKNCYAAILCWDG